MKRLNTIVRSSFLILGILWTGCGPAEWAEAAIWGNGYTVHFKMPKPFTRAEAKIDLETGRTLFEKGFVTEGDEAHKFQIRMLEMAVGNWAMDGFQPRQVVDLALNRENADADKMLDVHEFTDPNWPEKVNLAEEFTIESGDGKTIRHSRILIYEAVGTKDNYACYVLLTASRPKDESRSVYVDKFFNSLKICPGEASNDPC